MEINNKNIFVFGAGKTGLSVVKFLKKQNNINITLYDKIIKKK